MRLGTLLGSTLVLGAALTASVMLVGAAGAEAAGTQGVRAAAAPYAPGEVLVRFKGRVGASRSAGVRANVRAELLRELPLPGLELVRVEGSLSVEEAVARFEAHPDVLYAEPNYRFERAGVPNDPQFTNQWSLHNVGQTVSSLSFSITGTPDSDIDAVDAWDLETGSDSVVVAVVDSGVAYDHPDLAQNIWSNPGETGGGKETNGVDDDANGYVDDFRGWDFWEDDNDPYDSNGHGTASASVVGARGNDGSGVAGLSWEVSLMPLKDGDAFTLVAQLIESFLYAGDMGVDIVQASVSAGGPSQALEDAVAAAPNTLFVVAAGNDSVDVEITPQYPCTFAAANLICTAATDEHDSLGDYSNFGASSVDLAAPGSFIRTAAPSFKTIFSDDFETDIASRWTLGGTNTNWGRTTATAGGGTHSLTDSPAGSYTNNTDSWARTTNPIDLTGESSCYLNYDLRMNVTDPDDILFVEFLPTDEFVWTYWDFWSFDHPDWFHDLTVSMHAFDGRPTRLRFSFVSDNTLTGDGAYVDNVVVKCRDLTYSGDEFGYWLGTSEAAPHVSGVAALVLAQNPGMTVAELKNRILTTVDPLPTLAGKTVTGGRLNAFKALQNAGETILSPSSVVILKGSLASGNAAGLASDDDSYLNVGSSTGGPTKAASWYGIFPGVPNALSSLAVTYKGKSSTTCPQTIRIRNHTAGTWELLDARGVGTSEVQVADLVPSGTLADYVSGPSGNGEVWVQVICQRRSARLPFVASGDLLRIVHG